MIQRRSLIITLVRMQTEAGRQRAMSLDDYLLSLGKQGDAQSARTLRRLLHLFAAARVHRHENILLTFEEYLLFSFLLSSPHPEVCSVLQRQVVFLASMRVVVQLALAFRLFDKDKTGTISRDEFMVILSS